MATTFSNNINVSNETSLTITLASLANAAGRVSTQVDITDANSNAPIAMYLYFHIRTGSVAPTAGNTVEFYLVNGDENGTAHVDGNFGTTDTGTIPTNFTASTIRDQLQLLVAIPMQTATAADYYVSTRVDNPPPRFSVYCFNNSGQTLDTTGANFYVRYQPIFGDGR